MYHTFYNFQKRYRQLNIDDLILGGATDISTPKIAYKTIIVGESEITKDFLTKNCNSARQYLDDVKSKIDTFLNDNPNFKDTKDNYYREFSIPKRHGGRRYLIDVEENLKKLQKDILIFFNGIGLYAHNSAHAFIKNRDCYTNAEPHKNNKCILAIDLHDFFNSITYDTLKKQLLNNALLWCIDKYYDNKFIDNICTLATYKNVLPQGSPLSPFLSNIFMLDFDYKITHMMSNNDIDKYIYTRYADDMCFSAPKFGNIKQFITDVDNLLKSCYNNTVIRNTSKTKILKNTCRCYITGIKINKNNELTYGHENKTALKIELFNLFQNYQNGEATLEEAQEVIGRFSYMKRIEPLYANYLENKLLKRFGATELTLGKHFKFN